MNLFSTRLDCRRHPYLHQLRYKSILLSERIFKDYRTQRHTRPITELPFPLLMAFPSVAHYQRCLELSLYQCRIIYGNFICEAFGQYHISSNLKLVLNTYGSRSRRILQYSWLSPFTEIYDSWNLIDRLAESKKIYISVSLLHQRSIVVPDSSRFFSRLYSFSLSRYSFNLLFALAFHEFNASV